MLASRTFTQKNFLPFAVLLLIGFLIYSNVLNGEFVSDDYTYVVANPYIRDVTDIRAIWLSFNTRFLPGLTFALNYRLGGLNTFGYHAANIMFHVLASFLVFQFVRLTLETPAVKGTRLTGGPGSVAFLSSLIFLAHPIQTQGVAFITQRFASMATVSYLLVMVFYVLARLRSKRSYYAAAVGALVAGMFCKENIVTVPVTLCVYELFFFPSEGRAWWRRLNRVAPFFCVWLLMPLVLMQDRPEAALGLKEQIIGRSVDWNYFFTEINVLRTYLRLFILPVNQIHEYDYPLVRGFWEPSVIISLVLLTALLGLAYFLFSRARPASFCILWFFITTSVEITVVSIVNKNLIYEHWLYLPMVGFAFFLSYVMHVFFRDGRRLRWAAVLLVFILALATYQRNYVWQYEIRFWQDSVGKSPGRPAPHFGLGRAWENRGYEGLAMQQYLKSLSINPKYDQALNNLAGIYLRRGDYNKAKELCKRIISVNPRFAEAYNNLAYIYYLEGDYREAVVYYQASLARQKPYPEGYFYMGQCFLGLGRTAEAGETLKKARDLHLKRNEPEKAREVERLLESVR